MDSRKAVVGFVVVFALFGLWRAVPWATQERGRIAGSPSLGGFFSANPVDVEAGQTACVKSVPLTAAVDRVNVSLTARSAQPLELTLVAPGYNTSAKTRGDYPTGAETTVSFDLGESPPGELLGELCIENAGDGAVAFSGTEEPRSVVVASTFVDGELRPDMAVTLYSDERTATVGFAGTLIDRASAMTGGLLPAPLLWLIALAFLVGLPVGAVAALVRSTDR